MAVATREDGIFLNLYVPMEAQVKTGKKNTVALKVETDYPVNGKVNIGVNPQKEERFKLALRIPSYINGVSATVNGQVQEVLHRGGYLCLDRTWKRGDEVVLEFGIQTQVVKDHNHQAVVRGPLVFARDSRGERHGARERTRLLCLDNVGSPRRAGNRSGRSCQQGGEAHPLL